MHSIHNPVSRYIMKARSCQTEEQSLLMQQSIQFSSQGMQIREISIRRYRHSSSSYDLSHRTVHQEIFYSFLWVSEFNNLQINSHQNYEIWIQICDEEHFGQKHGAGIVGAKIVV